MTGKETHTPPDGQRFVIRLFVTGDAPNSRIARENLRRIRQRLAEHEFDVDVVDVNDDPQAALEHGVFVTPALQVVEPEPGALVFGNLSDPDALKTLFPETDR
jgi:circadian clock protein KaiB